MIRLNLDASFIQRLKEYHGLCKQGIFKLESDTKSDYWKYASKTASIIFFHDYVLISGNTGLNIPRVNAPLNCAGEFLRDIIQKYYKLTILWFDKVIRLSHAHNLHTFLTYNMAYDYVINRHPSIDYNENSFRFDPLKLSPLFKNVKELKKNWFLKERYLINPHIIKTAFYHAMFSHFLDKKAKTYLEIGGGTGHLASFFHYYNKMKIVIIDIPETILYSSCYLRNIFPEACILLPHEVSNMSLETIINNDFIFILPSQIDMLPENIFDLAVNVVSMQEMTLSQICKYFTLIQKTCRDGALWCNSNRVEKVPNMVTKPIRAYEFPYNKKNEVIVNEINRFIRLVQSDNAIIHIEKIHKFL